MQRATTLAAHARQAGLATEKFAIDGTHTGTGGGNHLTLGGATPRRQPVPAPARPAAQPDHVLAAPPVAVLPVLRALRRPDEPGAARRRGSPRGARTSSRSRSRSWIGWRRQARRRRGRSTACCATCSPTSPATPTAPSSASTSCSTPTPSAAASGSSSCAASRCRRTRRWRSSRRCSCARWSRASGPSRTAGRSSAGAPSCTTASCCRGGSRPTSPTSSTTCAATASRSSTRGSSRSSSSASRASASSPSTASRSSCARRSSRGTCSARSVGAAARRATSTRSVERLQVRVDGLTDGRHVGHVQRRRPYRCSQPARRGRSSPACASGRGSRRRRCTRRSASTLR